MDGRAQNKPNHLYGNGEKGRNRCVRCGALRRPALTRAGMTHTALSEWSRDGGVTWTKKHFACSGGSKPELASPKVIVTSREEYAVDGGVVLDDMSGTSRIDLGGQEFDSGGRRAVSLFVRRGELGFYPIGARVRVTVELVGMPPKLAEA